MRSLLCLTTILSTLFQLNYGDFGKFLYFQKASKEAQKELQDIFANQKLTKQQQRDELNRWAETQGGEVQELFEKEQAMIDRIGAQQSEMIRKSDMSEEAKQVALQLTALSNNMTITSEEEANEYVAVMSRIPPEIQEQVYDFMLSMMRTFLGV